MKTTKTRFAPSPTGFLHVGGVRTALFNYLLAKQSGGSFMLRLEDTDRERFVHEGVSQIVESLEWLGLKPDEGFWINEGKHQNVEYIQSERQKAGHYQKFADQLLEQGLAYYSHISPDEYAKLKQAARSSGPFIYRHSMESVTTSGEDDRPLRLDIAEIAKTIDNADWEDEVRGKFKSDLSLMEDFIIIKSDGFPTYNFANVVDDHDMATSHVIRGDEFISSTGKHILMYKLFGWEPPKFIHLPVINGSDGKKLSKRTGDTNVLDYRDKGYLPEALINFLALLGWNDGTEQEIYSLDELIKGFSTANINISPTIFDQRRLDWMNGYWIREKLSLDELYKRVDQFWPEEAARADAAYKKQVLGLVQERLKYFAELPELSRFFFVDLPADSALISTHKQLKKLPTSDLKGLLEKTKLTLIDSGFSTADLSQRLNQLLEQTGQKPVLLFSLIRIATTQAPASPALADTLAVLGKTRSLERIDSQIKVLDQNPRPKS